MTNLKRDLEFVMLPDAIFRVEPGETLETYTHVKPGSNPSFMEFFFRASQRSFGKHNQEGWLSLYFFLGKYVRTESDILKLLYEEMHIKPPASLKSNARLSHHIPYMRIINKWMSGQFFMCFDNCQVVPDQILDSLKLLSAALNCKVLMLHRRNGL